MKRMILAAALLWLPVPVGANLDDSDRARNALERGEVLPLREILPMIERETGGRVVEVDFELDGEAYIYEFEFIDPQGRLMQAVVDATTGGVVSIGEEVDDD